MTADQNNVEMNRKTQKGSALLVTLMIIVGLSLLGLGAVAISETENSISANDRNSSETLAVAEAGVKMTVEWFQNPTWARTQGIMPANTNAVKTSRTVGANSGYYKTSGLLCDKPYYPSFVDRLYGDEASADVIVNMTTDATTINTINTKLFGSTTANPRITEIRVYAPSIRGGTLTDDGTGKKFWVGGTRFGVATIKATAQKFSTDPVNPTVISSRSVRVVLSEFPLPIPGGPIQTASLSGIDFGGASDVHWGPELSAGDINETKNPDVFPWANPYELAHFEHGYDAFNFPVVVGSLFDEANYLNELVGRAFTDPWFGTRAVLTNNTVNPGYHYYNTEANGATYSSFQYQDSNVYPNKKLVVFPTIDYKTWKRITTQGRGQKGLYYFKYNVSTGLFYRDGLGTGHTVAYWVNSTTGGANLGGGVYFFDTKDGTNPQNADGTTITSKLTPALSWQSSDFGNPFRMQGFIYLNAVEYKTTGAGSSSVTDYYNMPREPFRDVGFREVDTTTHRFKRDGGGNLLPLRGAGDGGDISYQDLNGNNRLDIVTTGPTNVTYNDSGVAGVGTSIRANQYLPKVWDDTGNCTAPPANYNGTNGTATDCSEPHEPFLNLIYPTTAAGTVTGGWEAGLGTQRNKVAGACAGLMGEPGCTTNSWDGKGGRVQLDAILDGILYNQGSYDVQGNAIYYGALLFHGAVSGKGNPAIYFNEDLLRGYTPPGMPRVLISAEETDENQ